MTDEELAQRIEQIDKQIAQLSAAVPQSPEEWAKAKEHIESLSKLVEQALRKADDEALRANSAKLACEEHFKFTAATRAQAEVEFGVINATKAKCEEIERA